MLQFYILYSKMITVLTISIALFFTLLYLLLKQYRYWYNNGVRQSSITDMVLDYLKLAFRLISVQEYTVRLYERFPNERYIGVFSLFSPLLYVKDLDLIKQIGIRDFEHFVDHIQFLSWDFDPVWSRSVVCLPGEAWKAMRATISPSFTISKMKEMFNLIKECADSFVTFYEDDAKTETIDAKDAFMKYANDVIASTIFGITCNSLQDPTNEFFVTGKNMVEGFWNRVSSMLPYFCPKLSKFLGINVLSKTATEFFRKLVKQNIKEREKNGVFRMDMIHMMLQAKKGKLKHDENLESDEGFACVKESAIGREERYKNLNLSIDDMTAQVLVFFFAGFDSSSRAMAFLAYELAVNPEVQLRLQEEIDNTFRECNGSITYDALLQMRYLDMVVSETLRKWPSIASIDRVCTKPYTIQPQKEGEKSVRINEGDLIWLPTHAIHRDPKIYPDPERFDPERFSEENKTKLNQYAYFPFGIGPRSCIGSRFALLSIKLLFFSLLSKFTIKIVDKTEIPLSLSKSQLNLVPSKGISVGFNLRYK